VLIALFSVTAEANVIAATAVRGGQKVNPMESVVNLLTKLQQQTKDEGRAEAVDYDKFACFCKDQADEKLYSITKKKEKIGLLSAEIEDLDARIMKVNKYILKRQKIVDEVTEALRKAQSLRDDEAEMYRSARADLSKTIEECGKAVEMLKKSIADTQLFQLATSMGRSLKSGGAALQSSEGSVRSAIKTLLATDSSREEPAEGEGEGEGGDGAHSTVIIDVVMSTERVFIRNRDDMDVTESNRKHDFNMAKSARNHQLNALNADIDEFNEEIAKKEERKQEADSDRTQTTSDMNADQNFMNDLTTQCEDRAQAYDTRSRTRWQEMSALHRALKTLKEQSEDKYTANKKLTVLAVSQKRSLAASTQKPMFFLQRSEGKSNRDLHTTEVEAVKYLEGRAKDLKSPDLSQLVVQMHADHFAKVRGLLKDMVAKLEADAASEAETKGWCDEEMTKAMTMRDENTRLVEDDNSRVTRSKAIIEELTEEIADLAEEISELGNGLNEATQLRVEDHANNDKNLADAAAGNDGVKTAISILKSFYDNSFVQVKQLYVPPNADASGKTVADMAPSTFEGEYEGNKGAAQGILGMLAVIQTDFERTIEQTHVDEADAESTFQTYKEETEQAIDEKNEVVKEKRHQAKTENNTLSEAQDDFKEHNRLKADALDALVKLKPQCVVDNDKASAEKKTRREEEIRSLKNAYKILDKM